MALSGDQLDDKPSSIRLETEVWITRSGLICEDQNDYCVSGVAQVVNGDIDSALELIGYRISDVDDLTTDGVLEASAEVKEKLKQLGQRAPGSYLLAHKNRVYGVIVNHLNECRVIGQINCIIPDKEPNSDYNSVFVQKDGNWQICRSRGKDLKAMIANGILFCIVSENGFAFLQTNDSTVEGIPNLVLVLNRGYLFFEEPKVDWIRLAVGLRIDEFATKKTTLLPNECIVTNRGSYVRNDDRIEVFGSHNAVLDYNAFQNMMTAMRTVGYKKVDSTAQAVESNSQLMPSAEEVSEEKVSSDSLEAKSGSQEPFDTDSEDYTRDSFS